ncbi:MAG: hypothetical protein ACYDEJ_03110 [Desulfitobacteriaceae bacterium]
MSQSIISILGMVIPKEVLVTLGGALGLIFLDVAFGIIASISRGDFDPRRLPNFLQANVLPFVGSLVLLAVCSAFIPQVEALFFAAAAPVAVKFLFDIKDKISKLIGVNIPQDPVTQIPVSITLPNDPPLAMPVISTPAASKTMPTEEKDDPQII